MRKMRPLWCAVCLLIISSRGWGNEESTITNEPAAANPTTDGAVLVLTAENFDETIAAHATIMVEFYAPWCGHCKTLEPEYARAAEILQEDGIPLAKVDATVETELAQRYEVSGFPTIKFFRNQIAYDYDGSRTTDSMVEFVRIRADPNWSPPPDEVLVLTADNFTEITMATDLILVEFYAPWCGHCKKLAPQYVKAAAALKATGSSVLLSKVDATVETELAKQYNVTGYPTLFMFRRGQLYPYGGPRDFHGIVNHMMEQSEPPSIVVTSQKALNKLIQSSSSGCVVAFLPSDHDDLLTSFNNIANHARDELFEFFYVTADQLSSQYPRPSVVAFLPIRYASKFEPSSVVLDFPGIDTDPSDWLDSVRTALRSLVGVRSRQNAQTWYSHPVLVAYLSINQAEDKEDFVYWREKLLPIATQYQGRIAVAMSDEVEFELELKELRLDQWGEEVAVAIWAGRKRRYAMEDDELTSESIGEFVEQFLAGELRPVVQSQPVPKKAKGPVTVVVGSTFEKVVMDQNKDVLIELYAPWCGHCKKLEPVYTQLAKQLKSYKNLVIAKMDATVNDMPEGYEAAGYPTIYLSPAGGGAPVHYEGSRELQDLETFVRNHATVAFAKDEL